MKFSASFSHDTNRILTNDIKFHTNIKTSRENSKFKIQLVRLMKECKTKKNEWKYFSISCFIWRFIRFDSVDKQNIYRDIWLCFVEKNMSWIQYFTHSSQYFYLVYLFRFFLFLWFIIRLDFFVAIIKS